MKAKILIVEDEPIIAADIEMTLEANNYSIVGKAYSGLQALDMLSVRNPDLAILDISLKGDMSGIELAEIIKDKYNIPFLYLTSFSDNITLEMAKPTLPYGYIVKPFKDNDLLSSIEMALYRHSTENKVNEISMETIQKSTDITLTKMEYQVLILIWEGHSNKSIADGLFISVNTVKTHVRNIFEKFNVRSRNELIVRLRNL
jgi:DNA-binding NarL/FixJ family response regulator